MGGRHPNFMKVHENGSFWEEDTQISWNFMKLNCHLKAEFDQTHGVCRENIPETKDEGPPGDRY